MRSSLPRCSPSLGRARVQPARYVAPCSYFGKDGLAGQLGGEGNLEDLLKGQQPLDLGGATAVPSAEPGEDPLNYDPEGLYTNKATTLQDGHIARRMAFRNASSQEEAEKELEKQKEKALAAAEKRRAETEIPTEPATLVEFFLNCSAEDIEYFIAKCRDQLNPHFFAALDSAIGRQRFLEEPDEDAIAELEGLRAYIQESISAQDSIKQGVLSATSRLQKLLTSKDKKQCILDMAAANEIDLALIQLLQQNIDGAKAAGREDVAAFMDKVKDATSKYLIVPQKKPSVESSESQGRGPEDKPKSSPTIITV